MDLASAAARLDGYFLAIAALKDDGTSFRCIGVGGMNPLSAWSDAAQALGISAREFSLSPVPLALADVNLPESLKLWILNRIRPMKQADEAPLDCRLIHGLCDELLDIFGAVPQWFEVRCSEVPGKELHLGAFWNIYVFGKNEKTFALHCAWDS